MQRLQALRGRVQGAVAPRGPPSAAPATPAAPQQATVLRRPTDPLRRLRDRCTGLRLSCTAETRLEVRDLPHSALESTS